LLSIICFFRRADKLKTQDLWLLFGGLTLLCLFSYPAFSHDIFNYIFSGREVVLYHANPYSTTALQFPHDDWIRFMQWTHVPFAWGPVYLLLLLPFYLLGLGKFILTLASFKLMALLSYLGSAYIIRRLSGARGLILFALNPLIIYEAIVAGHVDIVMLFFALLAIYFWTKGQKMSLWVSLLISIGIKYATVVLTPIFLWPGKKLANSATILITLAFVSALGQVLSRELLPHYFLVPFGIVALYPEKRFWRDLVIVLSLIFILIRYLPFLYTGTWLTIRLPLTPF